MAYTYRLAYASSAAGETHTATFYGDNGTALGTQPTATFRDLGGGAYLCVVADMADGQGGAVKVVRSSDSAVVAAGVISPVETEGNVNMSQAFPVSPTSGTLGEALAAARSAGIGRWRIASNVLTLYKADGSTALATLNLTPAGGPYTERAP